MTDTTAAVLWAMIAGIFLANGVYACLMAHARNDMLLAALSWMFFALAIGAGMIGLLRTDWHDAIPLAYLKIIERSAFAIAALDGTAVVLMLSGSWDRNDRIQRLLRRWDDMMESRGNETT